MAGREKSFQKNTECIVEKYEASYQKRESDDFPFLALIEKCNTGGKKTNQLIDQSLAKQTQAIKCTWENNSATIKLVSN